jgi:signal peptidase I
MSYKFNIDDIVIEKKTGESYIITDRWKINDSARYECRVYFVSFDEVFACSDAKIFKEDDLERTLFDAKINIGEECAKENPVQSGGPLSALELGDIVITRDGTKYVYIPPMPHWQNWSYGTTEKGVLIDEDNFWVNIKDYDPQTLKVAKHSGLDIMEIWRPDSFLKIKDFNYGGDIRDTGTLIWIRQDQSEDKLCTYYFNKDSIEMFVKLFGRNWVNEIGRKAFGEKYRNALIGADTDGGETVAFYVRG